MPNDLHAPARAPRRWLWGLLGAVIAAYLLSRIIGDKNRNNICLYMSAHIGATNEDCANAIGLSSAAVGRHIRAIKAEWQTPLKKRKSK